MHDDRHERDAIQPRRRHGDPQRRRRVDHPPPHPVPFGRVRIPRVGVLERAVRPRERLEVVHEVVDGVAGESVVDDGRGLAGGHDRLDDVLAILVARLAIAVGQDDGLREEQGGEEGGEDGERAPADALRVGAGPRVARGAGHRGHFAGPAVRNESTETALFVDFVFKIKIKFYIY